MIHDKGETLKHITRIFRISNLNEASKLSKIHKLKDTITEMKKSKFNITIFLTKLEIKNNAGTYSYLLIYDYDSRTGYWTENYIQETHTATCQLHFERSITIN